MTQDIRWQQRFANYRKALKSLSNGIESNPSSDLELEGLIQRFEFTWELAWQTLQDVLVKRGVYTVKGPNPVIQEAGNLQIIS
jgi:nucleotidyltransferase substrate binding protein (TIGR01987 family)